MLKVKQAEPGPKMLLCLDFSCNLFWRNICTGKLVLSTSMLGVNHHCKWVQIEPREALSWPAYALAACQWWSPKTVQQSDTICCYKIYVCQLTGLYRSVISMLGHGLVFAANKDPIILGGIGLLSWDIFQWERFTALQKLFHREIPVPVFRIVQNPAISKDMNQWDTPTVSPQLGWWWSAVCLDGKTSLDCTLCWTTVKIRSHSFHRKWQQHKMKTMIISNMTPTRYFLVTPKNVHVCSMLWKS